MNNYQDNINYNNQSNNNMNQPIPQNNTNRFFNSPPQQNAQPQPTQEPLNQSINVIPTLGETIQPNLMDDLIRNDQPIQQVNNIPQNINAINTNIITNIKPQDINNLNQPQNEQPTQVKHNGYSEVNDEIKIESTNRFINIEQEENKNNNQLNIDREFENNTSKYENDKTVQKNIEKVKKKNTITITGEMKTILLIFIVLFLFIVVMPYIFDFLGTL